MCATHHGESVIMREIDSGAPTVSIVQNWREYASRQTSLLQQTGRLKC
jgi:hypothetical protein